MADDWSVLFKGLGRTVRFARFVLNLSQFELGRRAGTSQGTISRMETGTHPGLPIVSVARVIGVFATAPPVLTEALARSHSALFALGHAFPTALQPTETLPPDPGLRQLLLAYHELTPVQRALFVDLAFSLATRLRTTSSDVPPPTTDGGPG